MNLTQPPVWSKSNAELLNAFLKTGTGELFLAQIAFARPALLVAGTEPNSVALQAQVVGGYEKCLHEILTLATIPGEEEAAPKTDWKDLDAPAEPGEEKPR